MSHDDAVRARFGATAEGVAAHAREQVEQVRESVGLFLAPLRGDERVLDAGTGAGTLALALAPLVGEVVGIDLVPELLEAARRDAPANATFVEGDVTALPFESFSFDLACSRRTFHHVNRPELALAELARVTKPGGRVFVDDQIAPADPLAAFELDRFERRRDPVAPPDALGRRLPRPLRRERPHARAQQALHAPARARLLPRARRLHR